MDDPTSQQPTANSQERIAPAIHAAQARFERAVAAMGIDDAALATAPVCGTWSARDVAAHLADWAAEMLAVAEWCLGGERPTHHPITDGEAFNTAHAALHLGESWPIARDRLAATMARAASLAGHATPAQLELPLEYPWGGAGTLGELLAVLPEHHAEHVADLESCGSDGSAGRRRGG